MPSAPRTHTRAHTTEQPLVFLYIDYNGVLNSGTQDKLGEMTQFLVRLEDSTDTNYDLRIILLSKRSAQHGRKITLDEIADAGVLDLFYNIVFTSHRTRHDHHGDTTTEHYVYDDAEEETRRGPDGLPYHYQEFVDRLLAFAPEHLSLDTATEHADLFWDSAPGSSLESATHRRASYEFFRGGKEQYIHNQHGDRGDIKIVFVDDKAVNLEAVLAINPRAHCIEMRKHRFYTDPALCNHVRNSNELHHAIMTAIQ